MVTELAVWHISRGWARDPFVSTCGCEIAPCGLVVMDSNPNCADHAKNSGKTIRSAHTERACPLGPESTTT